MSTDGVPGSEQAPARSTPLVEGSRTVGPYKLLSVLGEGGMGIVYLAEQATPIRRRVALKVLKPGMDTQQVIARFESERQALAVMDHPNIAKVFDSGVTAAGRPYFVMEVAYGTSITDYADTHCLSTAERLRLFIDVCRAVQHAHQKGVIHRDLKPSNVLVTVADEGPVVKVIDFGIAKAVGIGLTDRTLVTRVGQMIGTPEYMSPEQAEMSGLDVDTRTDVYSLGVMLYELTVGTLPFDLAAKPGYAIPHTLREREVPRPSTKLTSLGDALDVIARHRRTTPDMLRREVRGDLDWIILKAMEKDRTRRYDTPTGLAFDIGRHLRDEPVLARPPSAGYRLGKFVRRNRVPVLAAAVAAVAVIAGAGAAAAGLVEARREQARAHAAAAEAQRAAATAEQVVGFLVDLFEVNNPSEARGSTVTAREVLDRGAERVTRQLADQPMVQGRLMRVIGTVYLQLGLYGAAASLLETAVEVTEGAAGVPEHAAGHGDADEALADALEKLGVAYRQQRRFPEAEQALLRSIELYHTAGRTGSAEHARAVRSLGGVYVQMPGRVDEAAPLLREALAIQQQVLGPEHRDLGATYSNLGVASLRQDDPAGAEAALRRAVAMRERDLGPDDPALGTTVANLGTAYYLQGRYAEAEAEYLRAARLMEAGLGPLHPNVGMILNNVGEVKWVQGKHAEAEPLLQRALAIKERSLGPDHASGAITLTLLANVYRDMRRHADAEPLYRRAIRINEAAAGVDPKEAGKTHEQFARLLRTVGRNGEAEEQERRAAALAAAAR
jgi:eukaryotic-like serine/threonine-protein kinase